MKERPILFSAPMVRAILDGRKTQTRRVVKRPKHTPMDYILDPSLLADAWRVWWKNPTFSRVGQSQQCPYGRPGDRLWVRETWATDPDGKPCYRTDCTASLNGNNYADQLEHDRRIGERWARWRPSIHMPRWASRITLEITAVRVERLLDISEQDAIAEGTPGGHGSVPGYQYGATPREHFYWLWEQINGPGFLTLDPWVWVVEFKRL